jgi:hypothetical protein
VSEGSGGEDGVVVRYDTMAAFTATSSWSYFDVQALDSFAAGFFGAVFDGRWIYFVPDDTQAHLMRFDTQGAFAAPTSWSGFAMSTVNPGPRSFAAGIFDGRYVYLVPNGHGAWNGLTSRYDTTARFSLPGSFATFDVASLEADLKGFLGGAFDGRYVYLAPQTNGAPFGKVARYDTVGAFGVAGSWSWFDTASLAAGAAGSAGALFDGRYVYFVPSTGSVVARFEAKEPASMPSGYSGSFY